MCGADDRVVAQPHVSVAHALAAVLEHEPRLQIQHAGHVLQARPEVEELGVLGQDAGLKVANLDGDR